MVFSKSFFIFALFCVISASCSINNIRDHPYGNLKPILECVMPSPTSGYSNAYFGFVNSELDTIEIPVGNDNKMVPPPQDRSQTEVFFNRRSRNFPISAFYAPFATSSQLTWQLNGYQVTASSKDNTCRTSWITFQIIVLQDTPPPQSKIDEMTGITQQILGASDGQIIGFKQDSAPTFHQIIMNMTTVEGSVSPMASMISLFGNTVLYDEYVLKLRGLGLVIVSVDTMNTGLEKMGEPISSSPTPTPTPSPTPSPRPPTGTPTPSPTSGDPIPSTPSDNTPVDGDHGPSVPEGPFEQPSFGAPVGVVPSSAMTTRLSQVIVVVIVMVAFIF